MNQLHPLCLVFPPMSGAELATDQARPTILWEDMILVGAERAHAAETANIACPTEKFTGTVAEAIAMVIARHQHRRFAEDQKGLIATELATFQILRGLYLSEETSLGESCRLLNVKAGTARAARQVVNRGSENIVRMVATGKIGTAVARRGTVGVSKAEMDAMTVDQVKERARRVKGDYDARTQEKKVTTARSRRKRRVIDVPYQTHEWCPVEETGFPIDGGLAEHDAFFKRYGRVPTRPQVIAHLLEDQSTVANLVASLLKLKTQDAARFFEQLDRLLAYVPVKDGKFGYETDFPAAARKKMQTILYLLPRLKALVAALEGGIAERMVENEFRAA